MFFQNRFSWEKFVASLAFFPELSREQIVMLCVCVDDKSFGASYCDLTDGTFFVSFGNGVEVAELWMQRLRVCFLVMSLEFKSVEKWIIKL